MRPTPRKRFIVRCIAAASRRTSSPSEFQYDDAEAFENTLSWLKFDRGVRQRLTEEPGEYLAEVRAALDAYRPQGVERWSEIRQMYIERRSVVGRIVKTTSIMKLGKGYVVDIGVKGFLPLEEADIRPVENMRRLVGRQLEFAITRIDDVGVLDEYRTAVFAAA